MTEKIKFESKDKKMLDYTDSHIQKVSQAFKKYGTQILKELGAPDLNDDLFHRVIAHDKSKYSEEEFIGYRKHFDPKPGEDKDEADALYARAWLHHQNTNSHHPEYWTLIDDSTHEVDGKTEAYAKITYLAMPKLDIAEMLCDWAAFGSPRAWFEKNQQYYTHIFHPDTYRLVDKVTKKIWG